mgnify:FL=1|jgi:hypothetical protein
MSRDGKRQTPKRPPWSRVHPRSRPQADLYTMSPWIDFPALFLVCKRLAKQPQASELPIAFLSPQYVADALRRVSRFANAATFLAGGLLESHMFCSGSSLTTLELDLSGEEDLRCVHRLVDGCYLLRTLKITTGADDNNTFRNARGLMHLEHSTLRRLEICDQSGGEGLYDFVESLTTKLEELKISWGVDNPEEDQPSDPGYRGFRLPRLRKLDILGELEMSAPLVRHISPSSFPALQDCTWRLYQTDYLEWRHTFSAPVAAAISQMRDQNLHKRAGPLNFTIRLDGPYYTEILQPALEEVGVHPDTKRGGVVIGPDSGPPFSFHPVNPSPVILVPQMYRKDNDDDSTVEEIGDAISVSLDRIRDLKDQAVAVGDRVQASRIAQALQEGEWLCVERQC